MWRFASTRSTIRHHAGELARPTRRWVRGIARFGHTALGVVYGLFGLLALNAAFGRGATPDGARGAIRTVAVQPFGRTLLVIIAAGLAGYVLWRFVQAIQDPGNKGRHFKGCMIRLGYVISGLIYAALAFSAARIALHGGGGGSSEASGKEWTAWAMSFPFGRWVVAIIGVIVGIVGIVHLHKVYTADFMCEYNLAELPPETRGVVMGIGRFGLAARGVVFAIIAWFLVQAALDYDPQEVKGLGGALDKLAAQPYGPWLMAVVAAGLVSFGIYCLTQARYRYFKVM